MNLPQIITKYFNELSALCERYGVKRLYIFGSLAKGNFNPVTSDIDFYVELEEMLPLQRGENLISLWEALENLFDRKVDLVTDQPIRNTFLKSSIDSTKQLIYDRTGEEILA
ncbi:MAG: nucleotidyltransferase domain-containing protein [Spirosomaceae bacterium]|nr:nucleotidyltransferase domain-containing protein [Spirosomataceae bacterium]